MTLYLSGQYSFRGEPPLDRDLPQPAEAECKFKIPESNWAKEITRCGFASILLFELELPDTDAPDDLQDAVTNLREAKSDIDSGKYSDAVYRSRKALESCHKALDEEAAIDRAKSEYKGEIDGEGRNDMSLTKRELLAGDVARHFMNQAPHPDETGQHVPHNRRQATLALRLAEAFLSSAIGRYRNSE
ncbi:hypothetical protein BSZ35_19190 [Salinibacter sp. 10B]|nr:hypothetical protein BSZ35_19190 [Salinibacter sp. 10B]